MLMKTIIVYFLLLSPLIAFSQSYEPPAPHSKKLLIIGDSLATGTLSGDVDLRPSKLLSNLFSRGLTDFKKSEGGLNFQENSFATVLSAHLGVKEVVNVAKIGAKVENLYSQYKAGIDQLKRPPDFIFISFTANDACGVGLFERSLRDFKIDYRTRWLHGRDQRSGLIKLVSELNPDRSVDIFILASVDFNQALESKEILNKSIPVSSKENLRCEQMLPNEHGELDLPLLLKKSRDVCKSILYTSPSSQLGEHVQRRQSLKEAHKIMIEVQRQIVEEVQRHLGPNIRLHFLESTAELKFKESHVANDCFHLSKIGQGFLGTKVWQEIFDKELMHSSKR